MGVRKLLKTSLALLAVGGVSFAGVAKADNVIDVNQKNASTRQETGPVDGKPLQVGNDNKVYVDQSAKSKVEIYIQQAKDSKAEKANAVTGNEVGEENDRLQMDIDNNDSKGTITFKVVQKTNNNKILNVKPNNTNADKKIHSNEGNINISITQEASDGNKVKFGHLFAVSGSSGSDAIKLVIDQKGGDTANFQNLEVGTMDLNIDQNGGSTIAFTDAKDLGSDKNYGVKVDGKLKGGITQTAASNFLADALHVKGDLTLHDYDGSDNLSQENGDVKLYQSTFEKNLTLNVTQEDSGSDTLLINNTTAGKNDVTLKLKQSGAGASSVKFGEEGKSGKVTLANSGSVTLDITQEAKDKESASISLATEDGAAAEIGSASNVTVKQTASGGDASINLATAKNATAKIGSASSVTVTQTASGGDASINLATANKATAEISSASNVTVKQTASGGDASINVAAGSDETVKISSISDFTVEQTATKGDVVISLGTGSQTLSIGTLTGKISQENKGGDDESSISIGYGEVSGTLTFKGYGEKDDTFKTSGNDNDYSITELNAANATLANTVSGNDNTIAVSHVDVSGDFNFKTNINGTGNTVKIHEESSKHAGADVDINVEADNVEVKGYSEDGKIDETGLVQEDTAASSTKTKGNYIDMDIKVDKAHVYLTQSANGATDINGAKYSNYADIQIVAASSATLKLYQGYDGGSAVANKAEVNINASGATVSAGAIQVQTGSGNNIFKYTAN